MNKRQKKKRDKKYWESQFVLVMVDGEDHILTGEELRIHTERTQANIERLLAEVRRANELGKETKSEETE